MRARAATPPQAIAGPTDRRARDRASHLVRAMRPRQWGKNLLVFLAPAAAGVLSHFGVFLHVLGAFGVFCAAAAGTYLVNDAVDAEADRRHPDKRHRPVANGDLPATAAVVSGAALATVGHRRCRGCVAGWSLALVVGGVRRRQHRLQPALKREPVVELAAVASCFVLRAVAGGAAAHVPLSNWFLVVTCFGALFVVVGKRVGRARPAGERARRPPTGPHQLHRRRSSGRR